MICLMAFAALQMWSSQVELSQGKTSLSKQKFCRGYDIQQDAASLWQVNQLCSCVRELAD